MKYDFDTPVQRFGTYSAKWDDDNFFRIITPNVRLDKDTIRLNLADMDFRLQFQEQCTKWRTTKTTAIQRPHQLQNTCRQLSAGISAATT